MDRNIDLCLQIFLTPTDASVESKISGLRSLLSLFDSSPIFQGIKWFIQVAEHEPFLFYGENDENIDEFFNSFNAEWPNTGSIWALSDDLGRFDLQFEWGHPAPEQFAIEIYRLDDRIISHSENFIDLIGSIVTSMRPRYLTLGSVVYAEKLSPVDKGRTGLGWMERVPSADLVQPLDTGTLIVPWVPFWQPYAPNPYYSAAAVERTQETELALLTLGALPTVADLLRK